MTIFFLLGYLLSKEEGQPGTPEKPLSDLGRVSYHAYWKSVVLEYLHKHRLEKIKLTDISRETGMYCHDIATALQLLSFVRILSTESGLKCALCINWSKVDAHAEKVAKSKTRIYIDHECLRWTPLLTPIVNPFREEKSDGEKDTSGGVVMETADIVVPPPDKIIIETQQGVKLKRGGRKRKISAARTPRQNTKNASLVQTTPHAAVTPEAEERVEEELVTSSGRKRTRPSKYKDSTYVDIKPKSHAEKRKRSESLTGEKENIEVDKKKLKADESKPVNASKQSSKIAQPISETAVNCKSKRGSKFSQRWSQRRTKHNQSQTPKSEVIPEPKSKVHPQPESIPVNVTLQSSEIKSSENEKKEPQLDCAVLSTPQAKKTRPRAMRRKRGWVKGRRRNADKKELIIPELLKNSEKVESETESIISEKSDDEATVKSKVDVLKSKDEKGKRGKRPSCEEDSSAEADDEMEDEGPSEKPTKSAKYKIAEKPDSATETDDVTKCDKLVHEEPLELEEKTNTLVEKQLNQKPTTAEYSTSSESETEIDGQKIKIISPEEVLQISQKGALLQRTRLDEEDIKPLTKPEAKNNKTDLAKKYSDVDEVQTKASIDTLSPGVNKEVAENNVDKTIRPKQEIESPDIQKQENMTDTETNSNLNKLEESKKCLSSIPQNQFSEKANNDHISQEKQTILQETINIDKIKYVKPGKTLENVVNLPVVSSNTHTDVKASTHKMEESYIVKNEDRAKSSEPSTTISEKVTPTVENQTVADEKSQAKIKVENKIPNSVEKVHSFKEPTLNEKTISRSNASDKLEHKTKFIEKIEKTEVTFIPNENKEKSEGTQISNNRKVDDTDLKSEPKNVDSRNINTDLERSSSKTCTSSVNKEKVVSDHSKVVNAIDDKPKQIIEDAKQKHSPTVALKLEAPAAPKTECITPPKVETLPPLKMEINKSEYTLPTLPIEPHHKQRIDEDKSRNYEEKCKIKTENKASNSYEKQHKVKEFKGEVLKPKDIQPKQTELKLKHEIADKRYDIKPKVNHLENEALLTRPEFPMTPNYPLTQGQYQQWHWDHLWGYRMTPIHIPSIDVLPPKHTEKEKLLLKTQRHESKHSSQQNKCKDKGEKCSPKKDDKKFRSIDMKHDSNSAKITDSIPNESKQCYNQLHHQLEEKGKSKSETHEMPHETKIDGPELMYQPHTPAPSVKHTPPTPGTTDMPSMGVYTPDSTTNSVHSLHYNPDMDVGPLGLESPTSISSDMASQNSIETARPSSELLAGGSHTNYDCTVQQNLANMHNQVQNASVPASSPNVPVHMQQQQQTTSSKRQMQQQRNRSNTPSSSNKTVRSTPPNVQHTVQHQQQRQRSTPPVQTPHQHMQASPTQVQHQSINAMQQQQQQLQAHLQHQVAALHQGYGHPHQLSTSSMHQHTHHAPHHSVISQGNYIPVPQMAVSSQPFSAQGASTYVTVPTMTTVIQHRQPSHQKLGPSAACAVTTGTNFYLQANPHAHTPGPIPTPTSASIPVSVQSNPSQNAGGNSSCSLAKLQQLTNDMIPHSSCSTMTPPPNAMTLTPPPPPTHHPHATMTPPPHQMIQNQSVRNLTTSPSAISANLQQPVLGYHHKYYQPNVNMNQLGGTVTPPMGQNLGRSGRNSANIAVQHMQSPSSRISPNVPNIVPPQYNLNEYRMAAQQTPAVTGYIANTAAGFINNAQIPMQMMNMTQPNYQNPSAIQRAQQNTMYTTHGYIYNNIMQPLSGTMRR